MHRIVSMLPPPPYMSCQTLLTRISRMSELLVENTALGVFLSSIPLLSAFLYEYVVSLPPLLRVRYVPPVAV